MARSLPLSKEVVLRILQFLPDKKTLLAAILSHRAFDDTFKADKLTILSHVRLNGMGATVLRLARIAIMAQAVPNYVKADVEEFLEDIGKELPVTLTPENVLAISMLHAHVEPAAARFASWALGRAPRVSAEALGPPSEAETARIQRALYFYHIASTLMPIVPRNQRGGNHEFDWDNVRTYEDCFRIKMAEWEFRQLQAVHLFFNITCEQAFNDLISYRPLCSCEPAECLLYEEYILTAGVPNLWRLLNRQLVRPSLYQDLAFLSQNKMHSKFELDDWEFLDNDDISEEPFTAEDEDVGPRLMFTWALEDVGSVERLYAARCGEKWVCHLDMMWDLRRMEAMTGGKCRQVLWGENIGPVFPDNDAPEE